MLNTTLGNLSDSPSVSPSGSGIFTRHTLAVPGPQLSGSRGSLNSDSHSNVSTPGAIRHRLRTVSVFGSPAVNRTLEEGKSNDSPVNPKKVYEKRHRKTSAPSSIHPFTSGSSDSPRLHSGREENSDANSGSDITRKASFSTSKDFSKYSKKLRVLMHQIAADPADNGIALRTHKYRHKMYFSCFLGGDLIEWLQKRDTNTQKETAMAIGQALLDFSYLQDLSATSGPQSTDSLKPAMAGSFCFNPRFCEEKPYRPEVIISNFAEMNLNPAAPITLGQPHKRKITVVNETSPLASSSKDVVEGNAVDATTLTEDEEDLIDGPEWFQDLITTDADIGTASIPNLDTSASSDQSTETPNDHKEKSYTAKKDSGAKFGQDLPEFQSSVACLDKFNVDGIECPEIDKIYMNHQREYMTRLITEENLSEIWLPPIEKFVKNIVQNTLIEFNNGDGMDIRDHVKIKIIPGGTIEDSLIVKGEVFSGRVIRRGMPLSVINPNVLLISESIGYPRHDKLVSMENLQAQQDEYVKNVVNKLKSFRPHVILSECGVCHGTQDGLHDAKIALILRVKEKVLKRVERLFDTKIITSLDSTHQPPPFGTCHRYSNKSFILDDGSRRNYIVLEHSEETQPMRGCTVLLRGGSAQELSCVKRVLRRMLLVRQNAKYEKSFLLTEYCQTEGFSPNFYSYDECPLSQMTLSPFVKIAEIEKPTIESLALDDPVKVDEKPSIQRSDINGVNLREVQDSKYVDASSFSKQNANEQLNKDDKSCKLEQNWDGRIASRNSNMEEIEETPELITTILTSGLEDKNVRNMLADFRANNCSKFTSNNKPTKLKGNIEVCDMTKKDTSIPGYFKRLEEKKLPIVYSSYSPISRVSPQYCVKPWVTGMAFYGSGDIPIGAYLEDFCFTNDEKCPHEDCNKPLRDHVRRFVLEDICVTLNVQDAEENMMVLNCDSSTIQMWRYCNE